MTSSKEDSLKINTKTMIIVLYINKFTKSLQFFCCSGHATKINKGGSAFQKVQKTLIQKSNFEEISSK